MKTRRKKNIGEILGRSLPEVEVTEDASRPLPRCSVGIEIEVEGIRSVSTTDQSALSQWAITHDGSLQNGIELVSKPVWGSAITQALEEARSFFRRHKAYLSFRTSVHVHINVLDMTASELAEMIRLYIFYEPALFRLHADWSRYENIFCVPAFKSTKIQEGYGKLLRDIKKNTCSGAYVGCKYAALNPNAVGNLGTLEFRHMGGTDDVDAISRWINILLQLKSAAINQEPFDEPESVFGKYLPELSIKQSDFNHGWEMMEYINMVGEL